MQQTAAPSPAQTAVAVARHQVENRRAILSKARWAAVLAAEVRLSVEFGKANPTQLADLTSVARTVVALRRAEFQRANPSAEHWENVREAEEALLLSTEFGKANPMN